MKKIIIDAFYMGDNKLESQGYILGGIIKQTQQKK